MPRDWIDFAGLFINATLAIVTGVYASLVRHQLREQKRQNDSLEAQIKENKLPNIILSYDWARYGDIGPEFPFYVFSVVNISNSSVFIQQVNVQGKSASLSPSIDRRAKASDFPRSVLLKSGEEFFLYSIGNNLLNRGPIDIEVIFYYTHTNNILHKVVFNLNNNQFGGSLDVKIVRSIETM